MITTTRSTPVETKCADCRAPCSHAILRLYLAEAPPEAEKRLTSVLARSGFEVAHRLSLSRLAEERLGVKTHDVQVLFLNHPVLLLQYLLTSGDPVLLFPLMAMLRARGRSTQLCFCSTWSTGELRSSGLSSYLAKQTEEKLIRVAAELGDSESEIFRDKA